MTVLDVVNRRGLKEVMHFTTNKGLAGMLFSGNLLSRARLDADAQLEYIFKPNAAFRKDKAWLDYVNLSISRVNSSFLGVSAGNWHRNEDIWWCILSYATDLLSDAGVYFTTTNNIYTGVLRGTNEEGLERLFSNRIVQWTGRVVTRPGQFPDHFTTCEQAEVLYPMQVPLTYLRRIYVAKEEDLYEVHGQLNVFDSRGVEVIVSPEQFGNAIG